MEMTDPRGWIFYYLICCVALLWVGFIATRGIMLWVGLFLTMIVLGFSIILLIMLFLELRSRDEEKKSPE